jgi:hypothetical protein
MDTQAVIDPEPDDAIDANFRARPGRHHDIVDEEPD